MKEKVIKISLIILGILCISYPFIAKAIGYFNQSQAISNYQAYSNTYSNEQKKEEIEKAQQYNDELQKDSYIDVSLGNQTVTEDDSYLNVLNIGEVMAYISIPKIDVNLPIYHGISDEVLNVGVGHLESSSLPVGGAGTHCVLTGHTGLAREKIFDDLKDLKIGDEFYIYVYDSVLKYEVDNINTVLPEDTEAIKIMPDEDYVTLVTCTPPVLNTHRLLVRGTRVKENGESEAVEAPVVDTSKIQGKSSINIMILVLLGFLVATLIIYIVYEKKND